MPISDLERVQLQKQERAATGGDDADSGEFLWDVLDSTEDAPDVRGLFLQPDSPAARDKTTGIYRNGDDLVFADKTNGATEYTLSDVLTGGSGLTEAGHEALDSLTHMLAETSFTEVTRVSGKTTNVTTWTDNGKTVKVREVAITRVSGRVSQYVLTQYDGAGALKNTLTGVITRTAGRVASIQDTKA